MREALGYGAPHFPLADHYAREGEEWMYGRGSHDKLTDSGDWREHIVLTQHRYMLEDVRIGLSFLVSVGELAGVPTPLARAFLAIGGAICGEDFMADGPHAGERWASAHLDRGSACKTLLRRGLADERAPAIACLGAGRMGRGIAVVFAYAGHSVALVDFKPRDDAGFRQGCRTRRSAKCAPRSPRSPASACSTPAAVDARSPRACRSLRRARRAGRAVVAPP